VGAPCRPRDSWVLHLLLGRAMNRIPPSKKAVYAALTGNLLVAATKAGAAIWTGSSAMASEALHSAYGNCIIQSPFRIRW
jgi:hypothetical protein